ncbi:hypothetical protein QTI66_38755 [Variovorax sp. J22R133]|nr:hypothetical protein [Variovorax sp. J22R133]MDM0118025.1 hypothetical protein [Variovorax sp. J22R133]
MVPFNLIAAGSYMPELGGSITPEGDMKRAPCSNASLKRAANTA